MFFVELSAGVLFFLNYVLAAVAVVLCVVLFRHYRRMGWLVLGAAFLTPFFFASLRLAHGLPFLTYRSYGITPAGSAQVWYRFDIPGFYLIVVVALALLVRDARRGR